MNGHWLLWLAGVTVFLSVPFFALVAAIGIAADDVTLFERVLLCVINPLGIVAAAWTLADEKVKAKWGGITATLCAVAAVVNVGASIMIMSGAGSGDPEVPLVFAVPFVCWLAWDRFAR